MASVDPELGAPGRIALHWPLVIGGFVPGRGELNGRTAVSPLAKRIVLSWIATDMIWASLFIYVLKREQG